ncbi:MULTISPECIES: hypothetical protein [Enterobacter cloacae complex]|uniref:hypothetical protein n=1 Tax=Enterobacter cloacae complex TaxID=354276 RepID=UPI0007351C72|nr:MULTISPECIES: hypothetical protein [Enterobacter cloacae complex]KTK24265.1 hypothetical protein ASU65_08655 [Enterobacter hormaechei subsp. xiangfangensis]KVJ78240.1 hypothetical protein AWS25_23820 [Enterobacter hormaechei subsp. xiangfangensis]MCM7930004.1 hypothetical protein [Enterobacter hormaechei]MCM7965417.1 hypothetical protein [Enterobacter hormaechei]MCM7968831.1 hypothetical protein [Enterobacter hormaechei]
MTFTKERLTALSRSENVGAILGEEIAELARIALASLEAEPVISHLGSKNALDAIVAFIKSNRNPTLKDHNQVSERLFQDNCHGLSNHVIEYIKQIGDELEELRSTQDTAPPAQEAPEVYNIGDATMRHIFTPAGITDVSDMQAVFDQIETVLAGMWQPAPVSVPDEEQCKPHPVMAVKGELGFLDNFDRIISERDEDIDIGQLGSGNCEALMLAALDAFRAAMLQGAERVSNRDELTDAVNGLFAVMDEYPESLVPINRDSAVVRQLRVAAGD